jgi:hypothetical protein
MRRPYLMVLVAVAVLLFLLVSALLARVFSIDGAERSAITALVKAEARGDAGAMRAQIEGCRVTSACQERVAQDVAALRRPGTLSILQVNPSAGFSLGSTVGTARVAWRADGSLPVVQCVRVRRAGNALTGLHVQLLEISRKIRTDSDCPARY